MNAPCRALLVLIVAPDAQALAGLRRAAVGVEWELVGATSTEEALRALEERRPSVVVALRPAPGLIDSIRARVPYIRIVVVGDAVDGADVAVASLEDVRGAIFGRPAAGGPRSG